MLALVFAVVLVAAVPRSDVAPLGITNATKLAAICASQNAGAMVRGREYKGNRFMVRCQHGVFLVRADGSVQKLRGGRP